MGLFWLALAGLDWPGLAWLVCFPCLYWPGLGFLASAGLVWPGLSIPWLGWPDWPGLAWSGLGWLGLGWSGLTCARLGWSGLGQVVWGRPGQRDSGIFRPNFLGAGLRPEIGIFTNMDERFA